MGDFPWMTDRGTFIINGTERVVVTQLVRSPGAYVMEPKDREKQVFIANLMPARGSWLELEIDKKGRVYARIDRKRKLPVTVLLRAMGFVTDEEILEAVRQLGLHPPHDRGRHRADQDRGGRADRAVQEAAARRAAVGRRRQGAARAALLRSQALRPHPGRPLQAERAPRPRRRPRHPRPDQGRHRRPDQGARQRCRSCSAIPEEIDEENPIKDYAAEAATYPREPINDHLDEYEHFGNRRLRTVGELIQDAFRVGLYRMERVVRERLTTEDADAITPQTIINIRPVVAALKEFFGSSQLSQFMDQTNSLAGLTHRRRLSALGAGGLTRERAPIEVRDVHPTHYGRMCPIETPEGPNIGLIGSLSSYAEVSEHGFVTTPYRVVKDGVVTNEIVHLDATQEEEQIDRPGERRGRPEDRQAQGPAGPLPHRRGRGRARAAEAGRR